MIQTKKLIEQKQKMKQENWYKKYGYQFTINKKQKVYRLYFYI